MTTATPTATDRLHALDAARALALLLGIALHASMSFFLPIPVQDPSASTTLAVGFFLIHSFRMTLFFLIAGYFGHLLWQRLGTRGFLRDRSRRIGLPLLGGWLLLAPISIAIVIWGLTRSGVPSELAQSTPADQGLPLVHLWFLYYLCLFYLATAALRAVLAWGDPTGRIGMVIDRTLAWALRHGLAPLLLALPAAVVLALDPGWRVWFGIHTPDVGLQPQLPASIAYGTAFAAGWWLQRQGSFLTDLASRWRSHLLLAVGLSTFALLLVGPRPNLFDATTLAGGEGRRVLYAAVYALSGWTWSFGLLGACQRWLAQPSARWRYLADASYWIYLLHLPLVFGLQVALRDWPLHWSLKFPLIVGLTMATLLLSYRGFVRGSWIGALLNGRRKAPGLELDVAAVATPDTPITSVVPAEQSPLAELRGVHKRYGQTTALGGLDLQVRAGELLAVLGPNGAGKSTAIGLWLGTLRSDSGEVHTLGGDPTDVHSRLELGCMLQDVRLSPMLSAREHIDLTRRCYRHPLTVDECIELAGIGAFAEQRYGQLSGGQQRQVQFALAICGRPRLLFLDEPTVGLDLAARERLWASLRQLVAQGRSIVLTTHYLEEAEALADRVAVLAGGRLLAEGSVAQMRELVSRTRIRCLSDVDASTVRQWPGVVEVSHQDRQLQLTASDPETVVRRLLQTDPRLSRLEVRPASLAEAFSELTLEAA